MKKIWNDWLKEGVFIYCAVYTAATLLNSVVYLAQGMRNDPSGNWHEVTRAMIVLIGVLVYELAKHIPIRNLVVRSIVVYAPTLLLALFAVWSTRFIEPLAPHAYRDVFINYTGLFIIVAVIAVTVHALRRKRTDIEAFGDSTN